MHQTPYYGNYLLRLQQILQHFELEHLCQDEVTFLQLHYMELLETEEIAGLMEAENSFIEEMAHKFSTKNLPAVS